jgi:hypothetical protein
LKGIQNPIGRDAAGSRTDMSCQELLPNRNLTLASCRQQLQQRTAHGFCVPCNVRRMPRILNARTLTGLSTAFYLCDSQTSRGYGDMSDQRSNFRFCVHCDLVLHARRQVSFLFPMASHSPSSAWGAVPGSFQGLGRDQFEEPGTNQRG